MKKKTNSYSNRRSTKGNRIHLKHLKWNYFYHKNNSESVTVVDGGIGIRNHLFNNLNSSMTRPFAQNNYEKETFVISANSVEKSLNQSSFLHKRLHMI